MTHVTDMVADAGSILGQVVWYQDHHHAWKLPAFGPLVGSFLAGSLLGGYGALQLRHMPLYSVSCVLFVSALAFIVMCFVRRRLISLQVKIAGIAKEPPSDDVVIGSMIVFSDAQEGEQRLLLVH